MNDFFDYASIMIRLKQLNKEIHDHLIDHRVKEAAPLAQEYLFQSRLLNLWITQEMQNRERI
jgi:hypothetical protein